jgi:citrate lyase subunit beta/citryl-CoA lyase
MMADVACPALREARALLFVPGDRPERFAKAIATRADLVIVDLEDAVPPDRKDWARSQIAQHIDASDRIMIRINAAGTRWIEDDLALCRQLGVAVMVPKAAAGNDLARVAASLPTIALIETAEGLLSAPAVAATFGVARLALGTVDLALNLQLDVADEAIDPIRLDLVVASRAARLNGPIDGVSLAIDDPDAVRQSMTRASRLGFGGKMCIHPAQVEPVLAGLRPDDAAIEQARRLVEADRQSGGAAVALGGEMVDRPLVERARRLLLRAGQNAA